MPGKKVKSHRHPWDRWFKKNKFTLEYGVDFESQLASMSQQIYAAASKRGLSVRIEMKGTVMVVSVLKRNVA